jgi:integrase
VSGARTGSAGPRHQHEAGTNDNPISGTAVGALATPENSTLPTRFVAHHEEIRPWSLEEAGTFLAAARGHRLSALFAVGVALGLRRGELLALAWDEC